MIDLVTAFVDTNLLLHYQFLDQVDWRTVLGAEQVVIQIAPVVIRELNKQKDENRSPKLRKRAASVLRQLDALAADGLEVQLRAAVTLCFGTDEPDLDYEAHHLDPGTQDDVLIAGVLAFRESNSGETVVLVTADLGLKLKARHHSIQITSPLEEAKLPDEPDPNEQRIRELEEEKTRWRLQVPALRVAFDDESDVTRFRLSSFHRPTADEIAERMARLAEKYPKLPREHEGPARGPQSVARMAAGLAASLNTLRGVTPEEYARYNRELEEFYGRYAGFIEEEMAFNELRNRTLCLSIVLVNDGTSPGDDIDIFLHFPDGFELHDEGGLPRPPKPPAPPAKPMSPIERLASMSRGLSYDPLSFRMPDISPPGNVSGPEIRRSDSYEVEFHVQRLKHSLSETFGPLFIVFNSYEDAGSFHIDYRLNAANMPQEATGQLHVVIEKEKEQGSE